MALRFAVLGHPIAHSRSPRMHGASFASLGLDATYEAFDVPEEALAPRLDELQRAGYRGLNLTIPLKARALTLVDEATPRAQLLGGVNTILFREDGRRLGDNTDGHGFLAALRAAGSHGCSGRTVMVLGCGGTGRALALTAAQAGASALRLANRTAQRAEAVADAIRHHFPEVAVTPLPSCRTAWLEAATQADLIIHTTSQGLDPHDTSLLPVEAFHAGQWVFDAVYTATLTPILATASRAGACTLNGLTMLVHQGAESFRLWSGGCEPDIDAMLRAIDDTGGTVEAVAGG